jgi:hydroxylaminobenzene mutase
VGLLWNHIRLASKLLTAKFWLALYGTFANLLAILLAAATGQGKMLPIAGGKEGTGITEILITGLLVTLALSMIAVCVLALMGFYKYMKEDN